MIVEHITSLGLLSLNVFWSKKSNPYLLRVLFNAAKPNLLQKIYKSHNHEYLFFLSSFSLLPHILQAPSCCPLFSFSFPAGKCRAWSASHKRTGSTGCPPSLNTCIQPLESLDPRLGSGVQGGSRILSSDWRQINQSVY